MKTVIGLVAGIVLGVCICAVPACESVNLGQTKQKIDDSQAKLDEAIVGQMGVKTSAELAKAKAEQAAKDAEKITDEAERAAAIAKAQKDAADAQKQIDKANETIATADRWAKELKKAQELLAAATKPDGTVDPADALAGAGALLPPPWNLLAMVGIPIGIGLVQEIRVRQKQKAAESIVNGFSAAAAEDPNMAKALVENKDTLRLNFTPEAAKIVNANKITSADKLVVTPD